MEGSTVEENWAKVQIPTIIPTIRLELTEDSVIVPFLLQQLQLHFFC